MDRKYIIAIVLSIALIFFIILRNVLLYENFYMLDPYVVKPLSSIIIDNVDYSQNSPFPGVGLHQFYYFTAIFHSITSLGFHQIIKFGGLFFIVLLGFFLMKLGKNIVPKKYIPIYIFLLISSAWILKRFSQTLRENIAFCLLILLLYIFTKENFEDYPVLVPAILIASILGTNPITASVVGGFLIIYSVYLVIFKVENYKSKIIYFWKTLLFGAIISTYYVIQLIGSLIWQIRYAKELVVDVRNVDYSYYFIKSSQFSFGIILLGLIGLIVLLFSLKSKESNKRNVNEIAILSLGTLMLVLYVISFIPASGLFQDRLLAYIYIFAAFLPIMWIERCAEKRFNKKLLVFVLFMIILVSTFNALQFGIWSPYGNVDFNRVESKMEDDSVQIICFGFDNDIIKYIDYRFTSACQEGEFVNEISALSSIDEIKAYSRERFSDKKEVYFLFGFDNRNEYKDTPLMTALSDSGLLTKYQNSHFEASVNL